MTSSLDHIKWCGSVLIRGIDVTLTDMQSQDRVFAILRALGGHPTRSLTEIANEVELSKTTVLRFLRSLEGAAWVTRTPDGRYALGPALIALAGQHLSSDTVLAAAAAPMMRLRDTLGETATLSRPHGASRTCVQEFPSTQPLRLVLGLGETGPLHAGASGLLLLAFMPAERRELVLTEEMSRLTDRTITSAEALALECERIRSQGYSVTHGQRTQGAVALAVPLADPAAEWGISALGVYGPEARCRGLDDEHRWLAAPRPARRWDVILARKGRPGRAGLQGLGRTQPLELPIPGPLAQLAEQETFNLLVVGSSPTGPTSPAVLRRPMGDVPLPRSPGTGRPWPGTPRRHR
jgi:IclR family acetate operon transcriptional repressor